MRWFDPFRRLGTALAFGLLLTLPLALLAAPAVWPTQQWTRSTPEAQGMDARAVAELVRFGHDNDMDSLMLTRHGHVVAEAYYAPFKPGMRHRQNSATKGVVGALTGIALAQGQLKGVDEPVLAFFPGRTVANLDARKQAITLQHLLDMTTGLDWVEPLADGVPRSMIAMRQSPDWVQYVLDQPVARAPGSAFSYNSGSSHVLAAVLADRVGLPLQDYAAQKLFGPLGIQDVVWQKDSQGRNIGGWGLYLQTPDMAKLGYLYLQRGQWDGQQVIPQAWVDRVFQARLPMQVSPNNDWRYADQWWSLPERDAYMAVGFFRQIILVMPRTGVVAAMTGRKHWSFPALLDRVAATVKSDAALPDDAPAQQQLQARIAEAAAGRTGEPSRPQPAWANSLSGKRYTMAPNAMGLSSFTLHLDAVPRYEIIQQAAPGRPDLKTFTGTLGMDGRFPPADASNPAVARARWSDDRTLGIELRWPEEGESAHYTLRFDGKQVAVEVLNGYGMKAALSGEARD